MDQECLERENPSILTLRFLLQNSSFGILKLIPNGADVVLWFFFGISKWVLLKIYRIESEPLGSIVSISPARIPKIQAVKSVFPSISEG